MTDHCHRCKGPVATQGHSTNVCKKYPGPQPPPGIIKGSVKAVLVHAPRHFCCPDNCQFDHPEEYEADIAMFERLGHTQLTEEPKRVLAYIAKLPVRT